MQCESRPCGPPHPTNRCMEGASSGFPSNQPLYGRGIFRFPIQPIAVWTGIFRFPVQPTAVWAVDLQVPRPYKYPMLRNALGSPSIQTLYGRSLRS